MATGRCQYRGVYLPGGLPYRGVYLPGGVPSRGTWDQTHPPPGRNLGPDIHTLSPRTDLGPEIPTPLWTDTNMRTLLTQVCLLLATVVVPLKYGTWSWNYSWDWPGESTQYKMILNSHQIYYARMGLIWNGTRFPSTVTGRWKMDQYNYEQKIHEIIKIVRLFFNMLLNLYPLLDKVEWL